MVSLDIREIVADFPSFRVGVVMAANLSITPDRPDELEREIRELETATTAVDDDCSLIPALKCWREAYRRFGVKSKSYRSSIERLFRNVRAGKGIPRICNLVDAYNAASLRFMMPVGADDLAAVTQPLSFRYTRSGDSFIALGDASQTADPPAPGEIVYADAVRCLCRRWNWYQDARSAISSRTTEAILTVQALDPVSAARVEEAVSHLGMMLISHCDARIATGVADRDHPAVHLSAAGCAQAEA
jgi:DNA/RNA-binding domain of Phe-tRNA-synthetase-like protein